MAVIPSRNMSDLYDDMWVPGETVEVRDKIRAFCEEHIRPIAHELNNKELANTGQEYPLEAIYRDSKIGEIYEGANEIQKLIVARQIFGR